jgi:hypothetical protein
MITTIIISVLSTWAVIGCAWYFLEEEEPFLVPLILGGPILWTLATIGTIINICQHNIYWGQTVTKVYPAKTFEYGVYGVGIWKLMIGCLVFKKSIDNDSEN